LCLNLAPFWLIKRLIIGDSSTVSTKNPLEVEGRVVEPLPNGMFAVQLENGQKVTAHIATATRLTFIRVIPGDRVLVELSPYDHTRGRITHRFK